MAAAREAVIQKTALRQAFENATIPKGRLGKRIERKLRGNAGNTRRYRLWNVNRSK